MGEGRGAREVGGVWRALSRGPEEEEEGWEEKMLLGKARRRWW